MRAPLFPLLVVLLGCGRDKAPPSPPVVERAKPAAPPPAVAQPPSATPAPSAAPAAPASGCRSLPWKDDEIAITGEGSKAFNAHHHRPIVVYATTVSVK